jgi:hypothetical protein
MPVETRAQLTARYLAVVLEALPVGTGLPEVEDGELEADGVEAEEARAQRVGWWEEELAEMASGSGTEGRQRFSGKKGDGLTHKEFTLMVKGSLADRFKSCKRMLATRWRERSSSRSIASTSGSFWTIRRN